MTPDEILKAGERARRFNVKVGPFEFVCRRPKMDELVQINGVTPSRTCQMIVIDWRNVRECDIIGAQGTTEPAQFDARVWAMWCSDRPDFWEPIVEAVRAQVERYGDELEAEQKHHSMAGDGAALSPAITA